MISSFLNKLLEVIAPRACVVCGARLAETEDSICTVCNLHLPRTGFQHAPEDNVMAKSFWARIPIERAAALFFYYAHSASSNILYSLKYRNHPEIGEYMGRMMGREFLESGFFTDIDMIVYVPLAHKRQRQRGYNQSREIAVGVSAVTGIPMNDKAVVRTSYQGSQTHLDRWRRQENVENVFRLNNSAGLTGKHILIIDDVVTTGATVIACAKAMMTVDKVRFSVLSLGFSKS